MATGYHVIEPKCLNMFFADPDYFDVSILLFGWIIDNLKRGGKFSDVDLSIIPVTYLGSYPAIGAQHRNKDVNVTQFERRINAAIEQLLREDSVAKFLEFAKSFKMKWRDID